MADLETKLKAIEYLEERCIDVENLKECDAYKEDYFIKLHANAGFDTIGEMFTDDVFEGIVQLVEGK